MAQVEKLGFPSFRHAPAWQHDASAKLDGVVSTTAGLPDDESQEHEASCCDCGGILSCVGLALLSPLTLGGYLYSCVAGSVWFTHAHWCRSVFFTREREELVTLRWGKYSGTYKTPGDIVFWCAVTASQATRPWSLTACVRQQQLRRA